MEYWVYLWTHFVSAVIIDSAFWGFKTILAPHEWLFWGWSFIPANISFIFKLVPSGIVKSFVSAYRFRAKKLCSWSYKYNYVKLYLHPLLELRFNFQPNMRYESKEYIVTREIRNDKASVFNSISKFKLSFSFRLRRC